MTTTSVNPTIRFPILNRLIVEGYGLYPGNTSSPGLDIAFKQGLTLIVGTNGLGKTTLITLVYRMFAGAWDLSRSTLAAAELGGASLEIFRLDARERALFSDRVNDAASEAVATMQFKVGDVEVSIVRRVDTLKLVSMEVNGKAHAVDEDTYHALMPSLAGVPSFGDWLLLLRHMVFYFEDRRSLVWDPSAQRQLFRMLFLPPEEARVWYQQERVILELDSQVRNDTAALNRLRRRVVSDEIATGDEASIRARLASLIPLQESDERKRNSLIGEVDALDERRREVRRELMTAESKAALLERELEDAKLKVIHSYFPTKSATAKYLYSLLITEKKCAVCGQSSQELSDELGARLERLCCVLCGSTSATPNDEGSQITSLDRERIDRLRADLSQVRERVSGQMLEMQHSADRYQVFSKELLKLGQEIDHRAQLIASLSDALPRDQAKLQEAKEELELIGAKITEDKVRLADLTATFVVLVNESNRKILQRSEEIKAAFADFAEGFLFERTQLKWSPQQRKLGQLSKVESASFELDMSGTDFGGLHRRSGPGAVSESQREFIDLAFRMALIEVAGAGLGGTLIIDAPESSLDAVFVERAAQVLCRFGGPKGTNRLVVASNLVDGRLLPEMIRRGVPKKEVHSRIVNLMNLAVPTAALKAEKKKYDEEWNQVLQEAGVL